MEWSDVLYYGLRLLSSLLTFLIIFSIFMIGSWIKEMVERAVCALEAIADGQDDDDDEEDDDEGNDGSGGDSKVVEQLLKEVGR